MSNQSTLVRHLALSGVLKTPDIIKAFQIVDRADFVPAGLREEAYEDYPLPIGFWQTISQPTTIAFMFELLDPKPGSITLEIGTWSGWTVALLAMIVGSTWYVTGLEILPELVELGKNNLKKYSFHNETILQASEALGIPGNRFDRILISAWADIFPAILLEQLNPGWKLVIPVGNSIFLYEKNMNYGILRKEYPGFVFVPLK